MYISSIISCVNFSDISITCKFNLDEIKSHIVCFPLPFSPDIISEFGKLSKLLVSIKIPFFNSFNGLTSVGPVEVPAIINLSVRSGVPSVPSQICHPSGISETVPLHIFISPLTGELHISQEIVTFPL